MVALFNSENCKWKLSKMNIFFSIWGRPCLIVSVVCPLPTQFLNPLLFLYTNTATVDWCSLNKLPVTSNCCMNAWRNYRCVNANTLIKPTILILFSGHIATPKGRGNARLTHGQYYCKHIICKKRKEHNFMHTFLHVGFKISYSSQKCMHACVVYYVV